MASPLGLTLALNPAMNRFISRISGAASLNASTYEEVEADVRATPQALFVVLLSSVCAGLGVLGMEGARPTAFISISILALGGWVLWAWLTFEIGTRVLPEPQTRADVGELLRTTGFASAPGLLRILGVIPGGMAVVFAISAIWMLLAMIVAVRQALDYRSTARVVAVCVLGWTLAIVMVGVIGMLFGPVLSYQ